MGPWNSAPASAPVRTFGIVTATPIASSSVGSNRPASPGPSAFGKNAGMGSQLVGSHQLNNSKLSGTSDGGGPSWIAPHVKNASPAVVAALAATKGAPRGRDPSPLQGGGVRTSRQDLKFARMAQGLASNPSGVEKVDSPEKILESLTGSPTRERGREERSYSNKSSRNVSPQRDVHNHNEAEAKRSAHVFADPPPSSAGGGGMQSIRDMRRRAARHSEEGTAVGAASSTQWRRNLTAKSRNCTTVTCKVWM